MKLQSKRPKCSLQPLNIALCAGGLLLVSGCATTGPRATEQQSIHECINRGDSAGALNYLNNGTLAKAGKPRSYDQFLYPAAMKNDTNVLRYLLTKGANPNFSSLAQGLETPIWAAAKKRNAEALKILLEHGGETQGKWNLSPFEMSFVEVEHPDLTTDLLIEAGARPRPKPAGNNEVQMYSAGSTRWAMASYYDRKGDTAAAIKFYDEAAEWCKLGAKKMLGEAKFYAFMNSPVTRTLLEGVDGAVQTYVAPQRQPVPSGEFHNPTSVQRIKGRVGNLRDKAERYAVYSKLCSDRAAELRQAAQPTKLD